MTADAAYVYSDDEFDYWEVATPFSSGMLLDVLWLDGPTEDGVETYSFGDCWMLAFYLQKVVGGDIVLLGDLDYWEHVCVRVGDRYLDVKGAHSLDELQNAWRFPATVWPDAPTNFPAFRAALQAEPAYTNPFTTRAFAKRLAASISLTPS
jgi:hypothetical protein